MKTCKKCGSTEFIKHGKSIACKPCKIRRRDAYKAANQEKIKIANIAYRAANKEKINKSSAEWYAANSEKRKISIEAYRAANAKKLKIAKAIWREKNKEKIKAATDAWQKANRESRRISAQNRLARKRANGGTLSKGLIEKLYKLQRGLCACGCRQQLGDDYHLDHRMPLALGGPNEDWNMQLLTATCNLQKHTKDPINFMQERGFLL